MLGKDDNAGIEAWMLIKFYPFDDTMYNANIKITSATIYLKTLYHFGDSTGALSFNMYHAFGVWTGDSIAYNDSLFSYPENYYNTTSIGNATLTDSIGNPLFGDTEWVHFNIPNSEVQNWLTTESDSVTNQGLVFEPTNSTMIKGFYSFNSTDTVYPVLTLNYTENDTPKTYSTTTGVAKYLSRASSLLKSKFSIPSDSLSYIQNGVSYRSTFHFDTLKTHSHVLLPSTILLHNAFIEVTLNPASSLFNLNKTYLADSLYAYLATDSTTINSSSITLSTTYTNAQHQHVYRFSVYNYVQTWLKNPSLIKKIYITGVNESLSFDRFALYGNNAALVLERPRLIIIYSTSK